MGGGGGRKGESGETMPANAAARVEVSYISNPRERGQWKYRDFKEPSRKKRGPDHADR